CAAGSAARQSLALPIRLRENFIGRALCGAASKRRVVSLQEALDDRPELFNCRCGPELSISDDCVFKRSMLRPVCFAWNLWNHALQYLLRRLSICQQMTNHGLDRDRFFFDF